MSDKVNPLPKGSYAFAHIEKSFWKMHTGTQHYSRYFIVVVTSATREGLVKTFVDSPNGTSKKNDRFTTIFSIPEEYAESAKGLFEKQEVDFTGFRDKEHLRLCLVNHSISD